VEHLARELGISRQKAYVELRAGRIPAIRLGRRYILPKAAIAEWLRNPAAFSESLASSSLRARNSTGGLRQ
jgi:excisionase family DNA binding protein